MEASVHVPVLLSEVLDALRPTSGGTIIDATINGGGHGRALLDALGPQGTLLGLDRDPALIDALRITAAHDVAAGRLRLANASFARMTEVAHAAGIVAADGILLDLGLSSHHFERSGRGFSFDRDEPLDLRFDPTDPTAAPAAALLHRTTPESLAEILRMYGEERYARRIARYIVEAGARRPIETATGLRDVVLEAIPARARRFGGRSVARIFQALRIVTNDELGAIERVLPQIPALLRPGGRVAVIAFHSLEDRLVKHFFRDATAAGLLRRVTKKPIRASLDEVRANPRARSARLRVAERHPSAHPLDGA